MIEEFNQHLIKAKLRKSQKTILSGGKTPHGKILGSGEANRHGMSKLPPGQREVPNWPVLDLGIQPDIPLEKWNIEVTGEVENPFKILAERAKLKPTARFVYLTGYDGYSTNLKLEEALDRDVLLVHRWNDIPLPREHGGPVRMITPRKYAWKGSKWIREIMFLPEDKLGFWELRGYSNTAEPWNEDRYAEPRVEN